VYLCPGQYVLMYVAVCMHIRTHLRTRAHARIHPHTERETMRSLTHTRSHAHLLPCSPGFSRASTTLPKSSPRSSSRSILHSSVREIVQKMKSRRRNLSCQLRSSVGAHFITSLITSHRPVFFVLVHTRTNITCMCVHVRGGGNVCI